MFDYRTPLIILAFSIPGILVIVPRSLKKLTGTFAARLPEGKTLPPLPVLGLVQVVQSLVVAGGLSFLGAFFAARTGLGAPFFKALAYQGDITQALPNPVPVLLLSIAGSVVFLALYYLVFQRWLDGQTFLAMDELRNGLGIASRLLYGGIVEEIIARWGVMGFFVWLLGFLPWIGETAAIWIAITISGILFGLGHVPGYLAGGCRKSVAFFTAEVVLNLWASLFFGFLFWKYGLLAAMVSHMLFHLVWYPIDLAVLNGRRGSVESAVPTAANVSVQ